MPSLPWLLTISLFATDAIVTVMLARIHGVSPWRIVVAINGVVGTCFIRGPRKAYAELIAHVDGGFRK